MKRHPLTRSKFPPLWLFSDERLQNRLADVVASLPVGSGLVLRHDSLPPRQRYQLLRQIMRQAKARQLTLLLAGDPALARRWGAHGVHMRHHIAGPVGRTGWAGQRRVGFIVSMPVHNRAEALRARKMGADIVFISPIYATRSHEGAPHLGDAAWLRLARLVGGAHCVALGGMSAEAGRALQRKIGNGHGRISWAGIDALDKACSDKRGKRRTEKPQ